jgi:hypothetical protein
LQIADVRKASTDITAAAKARDEGCTKEGGARSIDGWMDGRIEIDDGWIDDGWMCR